MKKLVLVTVIVVTFLSGCGSTWWCRSSSSGGMANFKADDAHCVFMADAAAGQPYMPPSAPTYYSSDGTTYTPAPDFSGVINILFQGSHRNNLYKNCMISKSYYEVQEGEKCRR